MTNLEITFCKEPLHVHHICGTWFYNFKQRQFFLYFVSNIKTHQTKNMFQKHCTDSDITKTNTVKSFFVIGHLI